MTMQRSPQDLVRGLSAARIAALVAPPAKKTQPPDPRPPAPPTPPKEVKRGRGSTLPQFQPRVPQEVVDSIRRERDAGARVIDLAAKYGVSAPYVTLVTYGMRRASGMVGGAL